MAITMLPRRPELPHRALIGGESVLFNSPEEKFLRLFDLCRELVKAGTPVEQAMPTMQLLGMGKAAVPLLRKMYWHAPEVAAFALRMILGEPLVHGFPSDTRTG